MNQHNLIILTSILAVIAGCSGGYQLRGVSTSYGYQKVEAPEPVYLGKKSQRFEVRPGDCARSPRPGMWDDCKGDRERVELMSTNKHYPGSNIWISFLIYLPDYFKTSRFVNADLGQIKMESSDLEGMAGGHKSYPPLIQLNARGTDYTACYHIINKTNCDIFNKIYNEYLFRDLIFENEILILYFF